jgi:hypothetical protein
MKKVYSLSLAGRIIYIGQTKLPLSVRLTAHFSAHPVLSQIPIWIRPYISIHEIEKCDIKEAVIRERYWIRYYKRCGQPLLNTNVGNKKISQPKHLYKSLSPKEAQAIINSNYYRLAALVGRSSETIRLAASKRRIKQAYFKIFLTDKLYVNQLNRLNNQE